MLRTQILVLLRTKIPVCCFTLPGSRLKKSRIHCLCMNTENAVLHTPLLIPIDTRLLFIPTSLHTLYVLTNGYVLMNGVCLPPSTGTQTIIEELDYDDDDESTTGAGHSHGGRGSRGRGGGGGGGGGGSGGTSGGGDTGTSFGTSFSASFIC